MREDKDPEMPDLNRMARGQICPDGAKIFAIVQQVKFFFFFFSTSALLNHHIFYYYENAAWKIVKSGTRHFDQKIMMGPGNVRGPEIW